MKQKKQHTVEWLLSGHNDEEKCISEAGITLSNELQEESHWCDFFLFFFFKTDISYSCLQCDNLHS